MEPLQPGRGQGRVVNKQRMDQNCFQAFALLSNRDVPIATHHITEIGDAGLRCDSPASLRRTELPSKSRQKQS